MDYVEQFKICGVDTRQVACILLHGKPNAATQGAVGVLGVDVDSPLHDVYKCVAVNGGIYTWELLSSGLSIMSANISGEGTESVQFPYSNLRTPAMYVVKIGDLILDKEGYLYQIDSLNSTYCIATYCGTQVVAYGKSAYVLAVENGFEGTEEEWLASLKGEKGDPASVDEVQAEVNALKEILYYGDGSKGLTYTHDADHATVTSAYYKITELAGYRIFIAKSSNCKPVTKIGNWAFDGVVSENDLFDVIIPNTVTEIGEYAFYGAYGPKADGSGEGGIDYLYVPKSIKKIGAYNSDAAKFIHYEGTASEFQSIEGYENLSTWSDITYNSYYSN